MTNFPKFYDDLNPRFWGDSEVLDDEPAVVPVTPVKKPVVDEWEIVGKQKKDRLETGVVTNVSRKKGFVKHRTTNEIFRFSTEMKLKIGDNISFTIKNDKNKTSFNEVHVKKKIKGQLKTK